MCLVQINRLNEYEKILKKAKKREDLIVSQKEEIKALNEQIKNAINNTKANFISKDKIFRKIDELRKEKENLQDMDEIVEISHRIIAYEDLLQENYSDTEKFISYLKKFNDATPKVEDLIKHIPYID